MSLLEGHGDTTMDRAGEGVVNGAERFGRILRQRRQNASKFVLLIQRLAGIEAKMKQYAQGEAFIEAVEDHGGRELMDRVWEAPTLLPALAEIREPQAMDRSCHSAARNRCLSNRSRRTTDTFPRH